MKATKTMLAFVVTSLITWLFLGSLFYLCSGDLSFREACTHGGVAMLMLLFGWIPAVIVSMDVDEKIA
jgi:hypothetical protein